MTVAIIRFPGTNCEEETLDALQSLSIDSEIINWNDAPNLLNSFHGFILPGGFSFQDRVRAGVIASKLDILKELKHQSDQYNKPILGICNGAQILVESGIISLNDQSSQLDSIIDFNYVDEHAIGFLSDWAFLKPFNSKDSIFLKYFNESDVIPTQVCHAEGRFIISGEPVSGLSYCTLEGEVTHTFPETPNGSTNSLGAISNSRGNVFAIMPHPERSLNQQRLPISIRKKIDHNQLTIASWDQLFLTFKESHD